MSCFKFGRKFFRLFFFVCWLFFLFVVFPGFNLEKVFASDMVFSDDFSDISSLANYDVYNNSGSVVVDSGFLRLSAPVGRQFPLIVLNNPILGGDFELEIGFQYLSKSDFGIGTVVSETYPTNTVFYDSYANSTYYTWRDTAGLWVGYLNSLGGKDVINLDDLNYHYFTLEKNGSYLKSYLGSSIPKEILLSSVESSLGTGYIWFGNPEKTRTTDGWSSLEVDYIKIFSPEDITFPYYSQLNTEWAGEEYDKSSEWAPEGESGIDRWGCALTSAAMIFKNYEVNHPVTSEESNPQVLNDWLNERPDGYIRNGLVNWIALTKYAKESKSTNNSPTALEFKKDKNIDVNSIDLPTILGLPGHFVVAHNEDVDNFDINDPADKLNTTLSKSSDIASTNTYIPSDTDLSYMMFVVNQEADIVLFDSDNDPGGGIFLEDPILDGVDGEGYSGKTLKTLLFPKPDSDSYSLRLFNSGTESRNFLLDAYLYDSEGEFVAESFEFLLPGGFEDFYKINFNKNSFEDSNIEYAISSLRELVWKYHELEDIKTKGNAQAVDNFLRYAEKFSTKFPWFQNRMLEFAKKYIQRHTPNSISESSSNELIVRIDSLLN